jgi:Bacterial Ig-like domain (group 2)
MPKQDRSRTAQRFHAFRIAVISLLVVGCSGDTGTNCTGPLCDTKGNGGGSAPVVGSIQLAVATFDLVIGETAQLQVQVLSNTGSTLGGEGVTYQASDESVATVSASGLITARGAGQTTIIVRSARTASVTATATVRVTDEVVTVEVQPAEATLGVGEAFQLQISAIGMSGNVVSLAGRRVVVESSNTVVATVSQSGVVTGRSTGEALVTVSVDGISAPPVTITVTPFAQVCFAGRIQIGERVPGTLEAQDACTREAGEYFQIWSFEGNAGETIQIELASGRFQSDGWVEDPLVILTRAGGNFLIDGTLIVDFDDDGGPALNARLTVRLPQTGEYWIFASTFEPAIEGDYELTLLRQGEWVRIDFDNQLLSSLDIFVDGELAGYLFGSSIESFFVPPTDLIDVFALLIAYGPNLFNADSNVGVVWNSVGTGVGQVEEFILTNVLGDGTTFFIPMVTNTGGAGLDFVVNWGLAEEVRCCESQPDDVDRQMWYHILFDDTEIRAYNAGADYAGGFLSWGNGVEFSADDIQAPDGQFFLTVGGAPVAGRSYPPVDRTGAAATRLRDPRSGARVVRLDGSGRVVPVDRETLRALEREYTGTSKPKGR